MRALTVPLLPPAGPARDCLNNVRDTVILPRETDIRGKTAPMVTRMNKPQNRKLELILDRNYRFIWG